MTAGEQDYGAPRAATPARTATDARAFRSGGLRARGSIKVSRPGEPLVSVVMPVLNGGVPFVTAMDSVLAQRYENVELIVVDGGSTDGTLAVLERNDRCIDVWISERDDGVYQAMNKGIELASGDMVAILNADDGYAPDALQRAVAALRASEAGYTFGSVVVRDTHGLPRFTAHPLADCTAEAHRPTGRMPFPHITMVVRRSLYHALGGYDTRYRIAADYEFALRLLRNDATGIELPGILGWVTQGGMSDSVANLAEKRSILRSAGVGPVRAALVYASSVTKRRISALLPSSALHRLLQWRGTRVQGWAKP